MIDACYNNIDYIYSKKLWYKRINYIINIINHINGYINIDYINQKAYNIVKNKIESENSIINYVNIRQILKKNKFGTQYRYINFYINKLTNNNDIKIDNNMIHNIIKEFIKN